MGMLYDVKRWTDCTTGMHLSEITSKSMVELPGQLDVVEKNKAICSNCF